MSKRITNIPPAKSLVNGIRAVGYSFATAVADIIDNSIPAGATSMRIYSDALADTPFFCFLDDGGGMNYGELQNAMLLGSSRDKPDSEIELGRFGLGLKSASLSQCRRFTVATKKNNELNAMAFDLDIIEETNDWSLEVLDGAECGRLPNIKKLKRQNSGTLVVWSNFDRMKDSSKNFEDTFRIAVDDAQKHTALVFHRFYERFEIYFNDHRVERRDPFLLDSAGRSQTGRTQEIQIDGSKIAVIAYTLPFANTLTVAEISLLGNPKSIYDDQGFYIYRNKRLIFWGSWMRMETRSELNKLARVLVDIPSSLDSIWSLDVKKSSAKIPDKIKAQILAVIKESTFKSTRTTRFPGIKEQSVGNKIWERTLVRDRVSQYSINRNNPVLKILKEAIGKEENILLDTLLSQIECYIPKHTIATDTNSDIQVLNLADTAEEQKLVDQVCGFLALFDSPKTQEEKLSELLASESYLKIANRKDEICKRISNG